MLHTAIGTAFVIALTYHLIFAVDYAIGWQTLARPIVAAPVMGLVLGDLKTGIIMGASLEAIYMGISGVGGSYPADTVAGAVLSVAFVLISGADVEAALALALPIGTAMAAVKNLMMPVYAVFAGWFSRLASEGESRKFAVLHVLCNFTLKTGAQTLVLFICVAFGLDHVQGLLGILPAFVMRGLNAAGGMLPAVGFGILISMIWSKELGAYFFVGFILVNYLSLPTVAVALAAGIMAVLTFFNDRPGKADRALDPISDLTVSGTGGPETKAKAEVCTTEEDFFA